MSKLCPSAQPGMENCRVLGLVLPKEDQLENDQLESVQPRVNQPEVDQPEVKKEVKPDVKKAKPVPRIVYLNEILPATDDVLSLSAPLKPTEVFRLAATCAEHKCPHFDGTYCRLATRIVEMLPAVVDTLPPCTIRKDCRWFSQEGAAACQRCPEITTVSYDLSPTVQKVAGLPVMYDR
jgi:hypothetical protein